MIDNDSTLWDTPNHYLPKGATFMPGKPGWNLNGVVATGDDDFCVTIFPVQSAGVARLVAEEDPQEFRDHLIQMRMVTISVYQREVPAFQQHRVTMALGSDLIWRVAPTDYFTADVAAAFVPVRGTVEMPYKVADAVLAVYRMNVATADGGLSIYDDEWDTMAEREDEGTCECGPDIHIP